VASVFRGKRALAFGCAFSRQLVLCIVLGLPSDFLLAWPTLGASDRGSGERVVSGFAWHVEVSATLVVGPGRAGRPHAPAETCEVGIPHIAACQTASEQKSRVERSAAQGLDAAKKLLS
jgi:hypothetical protein